MDRSSGFHLGNGTWSQQEGGLVIMLFAFTKRMAPFTYIQMAFPKRLSAWMWAIAAFPEWLTAWM